MNKGDEFWFWTFLAITNPKGSNRFYYFDKYNDELFGVVYNNEEVSPFFRNPYSSTLIDKQKKLIKKIEDFRNKKINTILLPALSLKDKREFLFEFTGNMIDKNLKLILTSEAQNLKDSDKFNFQTKIVNFNKSVAMEFDLKRGVFLARKINEIYFPLGISENTQILW